ncbi:hypothetical protein QC764_301590 [Podospora pseudoanserina]|uniref:Uncharacterized protein n=1 Tax=Podospora pseudoanserina TaxID=2609844 RepID=A0ABR0IBY8_9PEZI|nr:hypothetical protein QC764_301590 [Podospora pseudoanserina]
MACCCRLNLCDLPSCVLLHQLQIVNLSSSYSTTAIIRAQFGLLTIAVLQFLFSLSSAKSSDVTSLLLVTIALRPSFAMSGEAEKVTHQELTSASPASSTDVGETSKLADINAVANGDVDNKATGDNNKTGQVAPVASGGPVESHIAAPSSATLTPTPAPAPAPTSESLAEPSTSEENLDSAKTEPSGQTKATPPESVTLPAALVKTVTNGTTKDVETTDTPQKSTEAATSDVSAKPTEVNTDKVAEDAKNDKAAHAPAVNANGNTRDDDVEMGEAPVAPDSTAATKTAASIPPLGGGKRKAEEAFGDSNGDLGETQAQPEISITNAVNESEIPTKKRGPVRPKKQQKERKILTSVGRTARKTRSQGPV